MTLRQVVNKLYEEKIIKNPTTFLYVGPINQRALIQKVRYGEYFFLKRTYLTTKFSIR